MKKLFIFLLIFILASPGIVHACDCCSSMDFNSIQSVDQKPSPCCSVLDVQKDSCRIQKAIEFLPASQNVFISPLFLTAKFVSIPISMNFAVRESGPPGFSSHTPIYLADRTLRI